MDEQQLQDGGNRAVRGLLNTARGITKKVFICSAIPMLLQLVLMWLFGGFDGGLEGVPALYWVVLLALLCLALASGEQLLVLTLTLKKFE